jgi:glycosyltransferase involved in cell wall biosynthesis
MGIAIDATILEDRRWTGVERYLAGLIQGLASLPTPHETLLVSRTPLSLPHELPPCIRAVTTGPSRLPISLWREAVLRPLLRREKCRIVHSGVTAVPLLPGRFSRIATVHELTWRHAEDPVRRLSTHKLRIAAAARWAERVIVNSRHTEADVLAEYPRLEGRTRVVYPGIDPAFTALDGPDPREDEVRSRFAVPAGPFFIFVGRIEPKKNIPAMLDALARPHPGNPSLLLVGKNLYGEDELREMIDSRGVASRVIRPGFVPDEDLVTLIRSASALLYVSEMEGFGFPPLEAMACGTPAIVSDRGAIPEVTGGAAIVVSPKDVDALAEAMRRVVEDAATRANLRTIGRERAAAFSYEAGAEALIRLYEELL